MPERVAIVGSRDYPDLEEVAAYVRTLPAGTVVVSGGARGVDSHAEGTARARGLEVFSYRPTRAGERWGIIKYTYAYGDEGARLAETFPTFSQAAYFRNGLVVKDSDRVEAFWTGSKGTRNSIELAEKAGKPVTVHRPKVAL